LYVDGVFVENQYTLDGRLLHDHTDTPGVENRPGVRIIRALPLFSRKFGLTGKADIVEFHKQQDGSEIPMPVDYKRGPRRKFDNDDAQLCAQALCLEEMLGVGVPRGAVFHAASRRRREVEFTPQLRELTENTILEIRGLLQTTALPPPVFSQRCDGCSLRDVCMPEAVARADKVRDYCREVFKPV